MQQLTYATVCSGIECMSAASYGLPLKPVFFSEIEPFPCAVLKSHFPDVPNLGDMSKITITNDGKEISNGTTRIVLDRRIDILAGGTPCQDVSVAGKGKGMAEGSGTRSSLAFEFVRLAREVKPRYILWENVAGAIQSNNAKDFIAFLRAIDDSGYGCAWRVLDAQYVRVDGFPRGIPQRRRRVWVVGCLGGDVAKAAEILFERDCIVGNTPPSRRTGQGFATPFEGRDCIHDRMVEGAPRNDIIALDGDKLKPRTDQRKGGNGFGINEDGAGYTLTGVDRHGVAYKRTNAKGEDVCNTIGADDTTHNGQDHVNLSVVECFNKVSHARGADGEGERWAEGDVASTRNTFDIGDKRAQEVVVHSVNSNGGDVMPTISADEHKGAQNQKDLGGVYCP